MSRTFLIDTDTASDDAVALIMALRHPDVHIAAITVVSGNVPLKQAVTNALLTVELCGADVPVFAGADAPHVRDRAHAEWFHGADGLGDMSYPPPKRKVESIHGVDAMIECIRKNPRLTLVTLGPLSNVAHALVREPSIARHVARCVVMGGNPCCEGNVTPAAEYNIWCDPEAARAVFRSGMPVEMAGWQLCRGSAMLDHDDIARIRAIDTPLAHFAIDCNRVAMESARRQSGEIGIALPDPIAMAIALDPSIATRADDHHVEIECASELTRGQTVVDRLGVAGDDRNRGIWSELLGGPKVKVVWDIDVRRWRELLIRSLLPARGS
jgi:purine nucleosidase